MHVTGPSLLRCSKWGIDVQERRRVAVFRGFEVLAGCSFPYTVSRARSTEGRGRIDLRWRGEERSGSQRVAEDRREGLKRR